MNELRTGFEACVTRTSSAGAQRLSGWLMSIGLLLAEPCIAAQTEEVQQPAEKGIDLSVGLIAGAAPDYLGSDDYAATLAPFVSLQYGAFFAGMEGIGFGYQTDSGLDLGVALNYDSGRLDGKRESSSFWSSRGSEDLKGMGRIKGSTVLALTASQAVSSWLSLDAMADIRLSGQEKRGNQYSVGFTTRPWLSDTGMLSVGLRADIADEDYSQTYFGVNPQQAINSGYPVFLAERGVFAWTLALEWMEQLTENWSVLAIMEASKFSNKINESPIVKNDVNGVIGAGFVYTF